MPGVSGDGCQLFAVLSDPLFIFGYFSINTILSIMDYSPLKFIKELKNELCFCQNDVYRPID
jgi:hypothetical protein